MNRKLIRLFSLFGLAAPLAAALVIAASVSLSPWFRMDANALSDLGAGGFGSVVFNSGLGMTSAVLMLFSACLLELTKENRVGTAGAVLHLAASLSLLGVALFPVTENPYHWISSAAFFVTLPASAAILGFYHLRSGSRLFAALGLASAVAAWGVWLLRWPSVAIPETLAVLAIAAWQIPLALSLYRDPPGEDPTPAL